MKKPRIVVVDDEDNFSAILPDTGQILFERIDPVDLKKLDKSNNKKLQKLLSSADIVFVDHGLDLEQESFISSWDGPTVVSHFRSLARHSRSSATHLRLPDLPIVLITSDPENYKNEVADVGISRPIGGTFVGREFMISSALDVEWLIWKGAPDVENWIRSLAINSMNCRETIGKGGASIDEVNSWIGLDKLKEVAWYAQATAQTLRSHPPISAFNRSKSGAKVIPRGASTVIRWFLNRVLPFPGFLISDKYCAATLRVTEDSLREFAVSSRIRPFRKKLAECEFLGPFCDVWPRRWWTAGIENLAGEIQKLATDQRNYQKALDTLSMGILKSQLIDDPVVTWNLDFVENDIVDISAAVQINPSGWPIDSPQPWIKKSDSKSQAVRALIDPRDLASLKRG